MQYSRLGSSGLQVSRLGLGAMNFGTPGWGCDRDEAAAIVGLYRDAGGTFFDTANVYGAGASEEILGDLLRHDRDEVVVATKVGMTLAQGPNTGGLSRKNIRNSLEGSLRRLGTDYVDLLQVHHYDDAVPMEETLEALDELVGAGLIRYAGCSNFHAWQIAEAVGLANLPGRVRFVAAQMMYNLIRRDVEHQHVEAAAHLQVALIAYGPLHSGMLAGGWTHRAEIPRESRIAAHPEVYLADEERAFAITTEVVRCADELGCTPGQLALAWVYGRAGFTGVLTAAQSREELAQQLVALELDVPEATLRSLDEVSALPIGYPTDFYRRHRAREQVRHAAASGS